MRRRTPRSSAGCSPAKRGPARDVVLLNAGAALFVAGRAPSVRAGIENAARAIDSGAARATLERMVRAVASRGCGMSAPDLLATIVAATERITDGAARA